MPFRATSRLTVLLGGLFLLLLCSSLPAKVQISADYGWNSRFRVGKWAPIYVTLSDAQPREVLLQLNAPSDRRYAMKIFQRLTIGPTQITVPLYAPLSYRLDETSVDVLDPADERLLAQQVLRSDIPGNNNDFVPIGDSQMSMIGISGNSEGSRLLQTQLTSERVTTGFLSPARLPEAVLGYDSLDLLILNSPDLTRMSEDQQQSIADWVRGGGLLVMWPGADPMPTSGPLVAILPATVREQNTIKIDSGFAGRSGIPPRFTSQRARRLDQPVASAVKVPVFNSNGPVGYRNWVGYGQVLLLPSDLSQLVFNQPTDGFKFWQRLLKDMIELRDLKSTPPTSTREPWTTQQLFDSLGDVPGAGAFGFTYVAATLIAMMFVVGPVDWFVLKWLGRQPWTWVTTAGWIGLITVSAICIGRVFKSGDVHFRTATLIDEANGSRVATFQLSAIYSPQTADYSLKTDPRSWWQPAALSNSGGSTPVRTDVPFHQDYRGNQPLEMLINVWNLRFVQGIRYGAAAPIIESKLTRSGKKISGKITNRGPAALTDVKLRVGDGFIELKDAIAPGATLDVSVDVKPTPPTLPQGGDNHPATTRPSEGPMGAATPTRTERIDEILKQRADVATVSAMFESPPENLSLDTPEQKQFHTGMVRSLVPLESP